MILLDTDVFSLLQYPDSPEVVRMRARIAQLDPPQLVATTAVTYEEQVRGRLAFINAAKTSARLVDGYRYLRQQIQNFMRADVVDFDEAAAVMAESLYKAKLRIGTMDLRNAAVAMSHDALLLSRNLRDFRRIPGLRVEDWTRP